MTYDMTRYQLEGLSTEAPLTQETLDMLVRTWEVTSENLFEMATMGQHMDRVKRTVYYGKVDSELMDELMPNYPTGEKGERIKQMARVLHAVIGLITEVGEICEDITKFIDEGGELDVKNLKIENGDLLWYINLFLACLKTTIVEVAYENIIKLRTRFPNKFTQLDAINRDHAKEQTAIESRGINNPIQNSLEKIGFAAGTEIINFLKLSRKFRQTPIVDDDFESIKNQFDSDLEALSDKWLS